MFMTHKRMCTVQNVKHMQVIKKNCLNFFLYKWKFCFNNRIIIFPKNLKEKFRSNFTQNENIRTSEFNFFSLWDRNISFLKYVISVSCLSYNTAFKNVKLPLCKWQNNFISWFRPTCFNPKLFSTSPQHFSFLGL